MDESKAYNTYQIFQSLLLTKDAFGTKVVKNVTDPEHPYALSMKDVVDAADELQPYLKEWYEWQEKMRRAKGTPGEDVLKKEYENWYWGTVMDGLEDGIDTPAHENDGPVEKKHDNGKAPEKAKDSCDAKKDVKRPEEAPEEYKKLFLDEYVAEMVRFGHMVERELSGDKGVIFLQIDGLDLTHDLFGPHANFKTICDMVKFLAASECQIVLLCKSSSEVSYHATGFRTLLSCLEKNELEAPDLITRHEPYADAYIQSYIDPKGSQRSNDGRWVMFGDFETWNPEIEKHIVPLDWAKPINDSDMMRAACILRESKN